MLLGFATSIAAHELGHVTASLAVGGKPTIGFDAGRPVVYPGIDPAKDPDKQLLFSSAGRVVQIVMDELLLDIPRGQSGSFEHGILADGIVRFAVQQRPVRVIPGTFHSGLSPDARQRFPGARATIKYDVTEHGHVRPGSIEVLHSTHEMVTRAITDALMRARFYPAQSNCARVALSVVQNFDLRR